MVAWAKKVAWQRCLPKQQIAATSATILTYGSYGLGVSFCCEMKCRLLIAHFEISSLWLCILNDLNFSKLRALWSYPPQFACNAPIHYHMFVSIFNFFFNQAQHSTIDLRHVNWFECTIPINVSLLILITYFVFVKRVCEFYLSGSFRFMIQSLILMLYVLVLSSPL